MNNTIVTVNGQPINIFDFWINTDEGNVMKLSEIILDNEFSPEDIEAMVNLGDGEKYHFGHCGTSYIQRIPAEYFTEWAEMGSSQSFPEYMEALLHYDVQDEKEN